MRKTSVIAIREYLAAVKTKSFIISIILMPVMMFGSLFVQRATRNIVDVSDKRIAVIDRTGGRVLEAIERANNTRSQRELNDAETGKQIRSRFIFESVQPASDSDEEAVKKQRFELSERVQKNELFAFIEVGRDIFRPRVPTTAPSALTTGSPPTMDPDAMLDTASRALGDNNIVRYTTNRLTFGELRSFLQITLNRAVYIERLSEAGAKLPPDQLLGLLVPPMLADRGLVQQQQGGRLVEQNQSGQFLAFIRPLALVMLMFVVVLVGVSPMATNVVEEKQLRIAEVLLGSVRPFELMLGKLLGGVGVALTLGLVYMLGMVVAAQQFNLGRYITFDLIAWFIVFVIIATMMFGSLFVAAGAAVTNVKEAQSLITPIMLLIVIPFFFFSQLLANPSGVIGKALTYFPFSAPMVSVMRMSIPPGVPWIELALSAMSAIAMTLVVVWAAGRIFRIGILSQGQAPTLRQLIRWIARG